MALFSEPVNILHKTVSLYSFVKDVKDVLIRVTSIYNACVNRDKEQNLYMFILLFINL